MHVRLFPFFAAALALVFSDDAYAFFEPIADTAILKAVWAVVAAVSLTFLGLLVWPLKRLLLGRRQPDRLRRGKQTLDQPSE